MTAARPILFSGPMIQALLAGRKTQTRRVIARPLKNPGWTGYTYFGPSKNNPTCKSMAIENGPDYPDAADDVVLCPYGAAGDLLYVRETFGEFVRRSGVPVYRADGENALGSSNPWRPSIHMPRKYSRLTLKITEIRVQQLQEISQSDCIAEGIPSETNGFVHHVVADYRKLWTQINGAESWAANPWVWVVCFDVMQRNVDDVLRDAKAAA